MNEKEKILVFFGVVLPFVLGAVSGAYGKHLIRKIEAGELAK